jgi:hypothetical protein
MVDTTLYTVAWFLGTVMDKEKSAAGVGTLSFLNRGCISFFISVEN